MSAAPKPRPKTAYHHGDLHAALLQQTVELIRQRGGVNFSLRDLAAHVGVSHAAVYRHFADKAALLSAVAVHGFDLLRQALHEAGAGLDHDPAQQLARQGAAYVGFAVRYPGHFAAMFAPEIHRSGQAAQVLAAAEGAYQLLVHSVMRRLDETDATLASVQTEALRCWALVHGLACLQLSGNLSACVGQGDKLTSIENLEALVTGLL